MVEVCNQGQVAVDQLSTNNYDHDDSNSLINRNNSDIHSKNVAGPSEVSEGSRPKQKTVFTCWGKMQEWYWDFWD